VPNTPTKRDGRKENTHSTQAALQSAALRWFSTRGYDQAPVGSICADANVTVGALYHHYGDKKGLFAAVVEQVDAQLVQQAARAQASVLATGGAPWDAFMASINTVLEAGAHGPVRRLMLIDAPAVLGTQVWNDLRLRQGLGAMRTSIAALQAQGLLRGHDAERTARIVLGALYGAMDSLPTDGANTREALDDCRLCLWAMLAGLRLPPAP